MKRVLYYTSDDHLFLGFLEALERSACASIRVTEQGRCVDCDGQELEFVVAHNRDEARRWLQRHYVHLVVLDVRFTPDGSTPPEERIADGLAFIDDLDHPADLEARYGFHRILTLVSGPDAHRLDELLIELGAVGVGHVMRQRPHEQPHDPAFCEEVVETAFDMIHRREVGKTALAASGGGITGIYFELGALKCLDDVLSTGVNAFDMYFGISAGAVVTGVISMGYSVDEFMAALAGFPGGRIPPLDLRLFRLGHLNLADMSHRLKAALHAAARALLGALRLEPATVNSLFLDYTALVGPPFRSDLFEHILRHLFEAPDATNDFRDLRRPLFIGASDQDARRHVLFGSEGWDDVPISTAIQASLSIHPAFSAVRINGRYYEDGAVTRTSDFVEAIERGADLVFVLDPFVPYVSHEPGATNRRGILYNIDQDIRSLSFTRFENTRNWVLRKHPEVSSYTFLPSNRLRRLLSVNPMDHRPFLEIWRGAYISTFRRIQAVCHRLRGDLIPHGITLDLTRAAAVCERLEATTMPTFEDFFVDRDVVIKTPRLVSSPAGSPLRSTSESDVASKR